MKDQEKQASDVIEELDGVEVMELEDEDLEDVAGGRLALDDANENCGNTQCCTAQ